MFKSILPGELVFDIGSNRGDYVELFLSQGARVVAFEPQPAMVQILQDKFAHHPDVVIVNKGLGERPGVLNMHINTQSPEISTFDSSMLEMDRWKEQNWDSSIEVEITTLDQMIDIHGLPRFAKIDVEGFEKQVMLGLTRKIPAISIEWVPEKLDETRDIIWYARGLGFKRFNVGLGTNDGFFIPSWVSSEEVTTHLKKFGDSNPLIWGDVYAC
ncbi:FkbM family methyltransferase [Methylobacterium mesophilicum]